MDAFAVSAKSLEQAVQLAERTGALLEGIFVEDIDLIEVAGLPFLREVRTASRTEDVIDPARIEQELRVLARRAERILSEQAARHNVAWSFRIWRGSIDCDLLAAEVEADVFALTRLGASRVHFPVVSARSTAVAVMFTGSDASLRALDTANKLATDPDRVLNILLPVENVADAIHLQQLAISRLGRDARSVHFIHLADGSLADLVEMLADSNSAVLILERDNKLVHTPSLQQSLNKLNCPLLIVR